MSSTHAYSQNQIYILIHRLIHIFHAYIDSQHKATQMLRGELNTRSLGKTYQVQILAPAQNRLPNALVEEMEGELNKFWIKKN